MATDILAVTNRLRTAIRDTGGYRQVAKLSNVPKGTIENMVRGTRTSFTAFAKVAYACDVSLDWLATGQQQPSEGVVAPSKEATARVQRDADLDAAKAEMKMSLSDEAALLPQAEETEPPRLSPSQQRAFILAIHQLTIRSENADEQIAAFSRGFFYALSCG